MTDEQIIQAVDLCANGQEDCRKCPLHSVYSANCIKRLMNITLDLIKRQQVEIEDLIKQRDEQLRINRQVVRRNGKHVDERNRLKSKLEKEVDLNRELFEKMAKDEAEIERKGKILNSYALQYGTVTDQSKKIKEIKDEAYKEFAEEFEKRCIASGIYPAITKNILKNLVKERTDGNA